MPKKKKQITLYNEVKEVKVKENNNIAGNVKITVVQGGRKIRSFTRHNEATQALCEYIRDALLGDYVIAKRPGIIIPCRKVDGVLTEIFSAGIPDEGVLGRTSPSTGSTDIWAGGTLKFIIPETSLTSGMSINGFNLYSRGYDRKLFATLDLGDSSIIVSGNISLEIEWTMKVSPTVG